MISVDTILLLQQKVESAVQKIEQLKSENDALRAERSELTKALSEKTELLSRFSADEKKIEDGILGALNRLDSVENALLDGSQATVQPQVQASAQPEQAEPAQAEPVTQTSSIAQAATEPQGSETDWKAEARKWEARAKANRATAQQLETRLKQQAYEMEYED